MQADAAGTSEKHAAGKSLANLRGGRLGILNPTGEYNQRLALRHWSAAIAWSFLRSAGRRCWKALLAGAVWG